MTENNQHSLPAELTTLFSDCSSLVAKQRYQEALHTCLEGLDRFQDGDAFISPEVILHFQMLLRILERSLETAFGSEWEKQIPKISNPGIHCSFCCKRQEEVKKIIAGPNSYICNECIEVCVEVLATNPG